MSIGSVSIGSVNSGSVDLGSVSVGLAQLEPTQLYLPEGIAGGGGVRGVVEAMTSFPMVIVIGVVVVAVGCVWIRAMLQRQIDPRELAFRELSRRLKLSRSEIASLRAMGQTGGLGSPVGLVMSPSAVRRAAGVDS